MPTLIYCPGCYEYRALSAFRTYKGSRRLKTGPEPYTKRAVNCRICERRMAREKYARDKFISIEIPTDDDPARVPVIRCPLTPLEKGGFAAYSVDGQWLADGESALAIVAGLYANARKNNAG